MQRVLSTVMVVSSATALAQEPTPRQVAEGHLYVARDAARAGQCDIVIDLGKQVEQLDPQFYATSFSTDPAIATCLAQAPRTPPPPRPMPPPVPPPSAAIDREAPPRVQPNPIAVAPHGGVHVSARDGKPPLDAGRVIGEVLLGGLTAIPGGLVGALIGVGLCDEDDDEFLGCLGPALIGIYAGGIVGLSAGVYIVGTAGDQDGSFGAALFGGVVGGAVGLVGVADESTLPLLVVAPIVGAVVGFNLSRRWDDDASVALLPVDRGAGIAWSRRW